MSSRTHEAVQFERSGDTWRGAEARLHIVEEVPITFVIEEVGRFTIMALPQDLHALALGFMASEGLVTGLDDVERLEIADDDPHLVRARIARRGEGKRTPRPDATVLTAAGRAGNWSATGAAEGLARVGRTFTTTARAIAAAHEGMCDRQEVRKRTRGTHSAALFDATGEVLVSAEDVGRHNAVDKVVGAMLLERRETAGSGMVLSGRISLEMAAKCARAGVELVAAVSTPTTLALGTARRCDMTLCWAIRDGSLAVLTHPERVRE